MVTIKKLIDKIAFYYRILIFEIVIIINQFFIIDNIDRKRLFFPRLKAYFLTSVLFYIFYAHVLYVMWEWTTQSDEEARFFCYSITTHFLAIFVAYSLYLFFSLIFVRFYKRVKPAYTSFWCVLFWYSFTEYEIFWETEMVYMSTVNHALLFVFYFFLFLGILGIEFGVNLEEEYDDARLRHSEEAQKRGSAILEDEWFGVAMTDVKLSDSDRQMQFEMSKTSKFEDLLTEIFGNPDDFGENPLQVAERYEKHKRKMYPQLFEEFDAAMEELKDTYNATPTTISAFHELKWKDPQETQHWYYNTIKPLFNRYSYLLVIYYQIRDIFYLGFFKAKAVGIYSVYNPYYKYNKKWAYSRFSDVFWLFRPFYRIAFFLKKFIFYFSIYSYFRNRRWRLFQNRFYAQSIKLRKRRSGNYNFFKTRKKN